MSKELELNKTEVARRELETAIELFFGERDPVSIHTLAAAAYEVLSDVARDRSAGPMNLQEQLTKLFPSEAAEKLANLMRKPQNFFKHAGRDADATINFKPEQTEYLLLDACTKFPELAGYSTPPMTVFCYWFVISHDLPYRITDEQKGAFDNLKRVFAESPRHEFFSRGLQVVRRVFVVKAGG